MSMDNGTVPKSKRVGRLLDNLPPPACASALRGSILVDSAGGTSPTSAIHHGHGFFDRLRTRDYSGFVGHRSHRLCSPDLRNLHVGAFGRLASRGDVPQAMGVSTALYWAMFIFSISNGICEVVVNPMVSSSFPERQNALFEHPPSGWPGRAASLPAPSWGLTVFKGPLEYSNVSLLIPVAIYAFMLLGQHLPTPGNSQQEHLLAGLAALDGDPRDGHVELGTINRLDLQVHAHC